MRQAFTFCARWHCPPRSSVQPLHARGTPFDGATGTRLPPLNGPRTSTYGWRMRVLGGQKSIDSARSMLPALRFVLILEAEKSSLERIDPRAPDPCGCRQPWYGCCKQDFHALCQLPLLASSAGISGVTANHSGIVALPTSAGVEIRLECRASALSEHPRRAPHDICHGLAVLGMLTGRDEWIWQSVPGACKLPRRQRIKRFRPSQLKQLFLLRVQQRTYAAGARSRST